MAEGGYSHQPALSHRLEEGDGGGGHHHHHHQQQHVGNSGLPQRHTSPHHVSHTSSHSSQGSHPHHALIHGSPVRSGGSGDALAGASPSRSFPSNAQQQHPQHGQQVQLQQGTGAGSSSSASWSNIPLAVNSGDSRNSLDDDGSTANYPTTAAEILDLLKERIAILSGGRDRQGQSIITFPPMAKTYVYDRSNVRKVVQYLTSIPTEDVRENGFSVIVDARNSNWQNTKLILRTLQEALPAQIHVVYIIQPGQFWQKQQASRGHNKERGKLEFSTVKLSVVEKLIRHVESSQLTGDLGGFLPYNHEQWIKLRLDLEHFISSFNALMEHTSHVEQQLRVQHEANDPETAEEVLTRHIQLQDQLKKAPQNTIREGNELLRSLEQRDEAGTSSMTPDKINAIAIIKRLLDNIGRRQVQLDDLWRERKVVLEQLMEHRVFEKLIARVHNWLKTRGEEVMASRFEIGTSSETAMAIADQHDKFETKAKYQFNNLTQLRRMADKMAGGKHFAADTVQRQVSKLKARFNKFESNLTERRNIVKSSVKFHATMDQWRTQCQRSAHLLKQQQVSSDTNQEESQQVDHVQQLEKTTSQVLAEASKLLGLMEGVGQRSSDSGSGRGMPNYSSGIRHVKQMVDEVEKHRTRVGQLAEAQKLQNEQYRQLHSCEKDAREVTRWLGGMRQQLCSNHGHIGDSLAAAEKLVAEHEKFSGTAKKTYKYGCDLISAAQRTRRSCQLDPDSSSPLLTELNSIWEPLSLGIEETKSRLDLAKQYHALVEETMACYSKWSTPVHQLPKSPEIVEERLRDIAENKDNLEKKMRECIELGSTLLDRLCRPLLPGDPDFRSLNDNTKQSLSYLREKLEEIERHSLEMGSLLPQQEAILREFLLYCEFEHRIERVLLWMQEQGLTKIQGFSHIGENGEAVKTQVTEFKTFTEKCQEHTQEVEQVVREAPGVETQIQSFKSDLVKKTTSLKAVWDKFLQRVDNRRAVLHRTGCFYERVNKLLTLFDGLGSVLGSTKVADKAIAAYAEKRESVSKWFEEAKMEGGVLIEIFQKSSIDQGEPANRVRRELERLGEERKRVEQLWKDAKKSKGKAKTSGEGRETRRKSEERRPSTTDSVATTISMATTVSTATRPETEGQESNLPSSSIQSSPKEAPASIELTRSGSVERGKAKVKVVKTTEQSSETVSRWLTEEYAELEEEAYKNLEWLESECDSFLKSHTHFGDSCETAGTLKDEHTQFLEKIKPTCTKTEQVVESLGKLRPQAPPLASSIDQLCQAVSERVKSRKAVIAKRISVLSSFVELCSLFKQITADLQTLDDYLCEPIPTTVTIDTAQEVLDKYRPIMSGLKDCYGKAKSIGEHFLKESTEQKAGPKLAVGDACTSVAVDLGGLEGQYPDITERWLQREKFLSQTIDWQHFKATSDQICGWLRDSAEMFLQTRVELGTSLETAEDLLSELQEFEIRAKRTNEEVRSLLAKSEVMLSSAHFASSELRDRTWDLNSLHDNFRSRLEARGEVLRDTVTFFRNADELKNDMNMAIEGCNSLTRSGEDLPTKLKIASISTRFNNLKHEGDKLLMIFVTNESSLQRRNSKIKQKKRSDSASASELAIKQLLANLQGIFGSYKRAFERRQVSHRAATQMASPGRLRTRSEARSPSSSPSHQRYGGGTENHVGGAMRARTYTADYKPTDSATANAVKDKVATFNKKAQEEDHIQMPNFGITFDVRPRAKTADPSLGRPKGSPKHEREEPKPSTTVPTTAEEEQEKMEEREKREGEKVVPQVHDEVPPESASVPLRRKKGRSRGLSKDERKQKIAAIRELFETSDLANMMSEPGRQWRPAHMPDNAPAKRLSDNAKQTPQEAAESSKVESVNAASLSNGGKPGAETAVSSQNGARTSEIKSEPEGSKMEKTADELLKVGVVSKEGGSSDDTVVVNERTTSPSVVVSPPPETRPRLQTAPAVYKTVVKNLPSKKKQVITLNYEPPPSPLKSEQATKEEPPKSSQKRDLTTRDIPVAKGGSLERNDVPAFSRDARVTRSMSPQQRHRLQQKKEEARSQQTSPRGSNKSLLLQVAGKVSSLRNMFDSQAKNADSASPSLHKRSSSYSKPYQVKVPATPEESHDGGASVHQRSSSMDTTYRKKVTVTSTKCEGSPSSTATLPPPAPPPSEVRREYSPDIVPLVKPVARQPVKSLTQQKESPLTSSVADASSPHPPPRPHSPIGYILENQSDSGSDIESESEGSIYESDTSSLDEVDLEWVGGEDEVDLPWGHEDTDVALGEQRMFKSLSVVLSELVSSEFTYVQSLEALLTTYLPMFSYDHLPTFLQGKRDAIFANLEQLYSFQRKFYNELSVHETSLEGVCNTFIHHGAEFKCYVTFLANFDLGLRTLSSYGGSFFTDRQQEVGDELSLEERYGHVKQRLVDYDRSLKEVYMCSQKEYLHGVSIVKDALCVLHQLMQQVDNSIALQQLVGCDLPLDQGDVVRRDLFFVYTTQAKKHVHEMMVLLHKNHVVFARPKQKKGSDVIVYEFTNKMEVSELHMLETYKSRVDKFALCEGRPSTDNLFVLQPVTRDPLLKRVWIQALRPVIQKKRQTECLVSEEDMPLPLWFQSVKLRSEFNLSDAEQEGWFGSLRRRASIRGRGSIRRKRTDSMRRTKREKDSSTLTRKNSFGAKDSIRVSKKEKRETAVRSSNASTVSSTSSQLPPQGLATVHLATMSGGQFQSSLISDSTSYYEAVESYQAEREGFVSVSKGQLVEVLDDSGSNWMVITIPMATEDLQMEGFLPAHLLKQAAIHSRSSVPSSHTSHPASYASSSGTMGVDMTDNGSNKFEAETGQEVPRMEERAAARAEETTPTSSASTTTSPPISSEEKQPDEADEAKKLCSEETTGQATPAGARSKRKQPHPQEEDELSLRRKPHHLNFALNSSSREELNNRPMSDLTEIEATLSQPQQNFSDDMNGRQGLKYKLKGQSLMSSSLHSLPSSFSPAATPRSPHAYLGYNPLRIPEVTMSQPDIPNSVDRMRAREEVEKLREATVEEIAGSTDELDRADMYVAIADFEAAESTNISLTAGLYVHVLDSSRSDWWLVSSTEDRSAVGWVPANYLEKLIRVRSPASPMPDVFGEERGELQEILMKDRDASTNRRQLYRSSFLALTDVDGIEGPSQDQIDGLFSLSQLYVAVSEIKPVERGQLALAQDQVVKVIDPTKDNWWLVATFPDVEGKAPLEGWVPADKLQPKKDIREDASYAESLRNFVRPANPVPINGAVVSPSTRPLWVVLHDYTATESGMLTVHEGELVEVMDISRNEWCLVQPRSRQSVEGWVPTAYLKPYDASGCAHPSQLPPRFHPHSSPDDSDVETPERPTVFSPEMVEVADDEERKADARRRRMLVMTELATTEKDYVDKLGYCIENYLPAVERSSAPKSLKALQSTLFGNITDIYNFHKDVLLPKLTECESNPANLGDVFISSKEQLQMYVTYCQNKAASDTLYHEFTAFFEEVKAQLKDRLELPDYLIMPVQRITKYTLLLHDFHKSSVRSGSEVGNIAAALEVTKNISTQANNTIHLSLVEGSGIKELGNLALQDLFDIQEGQRLVFKERRVFLFQQALVITKQRRDSEGTTYIIKEQFMLTDISMTQDMEPKKRNIIIYDMQTGTKFILRAQTTSIRNSWLESSNQLIRKAKMEAAKTLTVKTPPVEQRRKTRPRSASAIHGRTISPVPVEQPGTLYVVMESIVMEGSDETLEMGDVVALVKMEPFSGMLRVKTLDEHHPIEGMIPESYLRKKDSLKGERMETAPRFTMKPNDLDLKTGNTATISCAFNGQPPPSVVWRQGNDVVTTDSRRKITSCGTSSVLEISSLEYEDEGVYTCFATNQLGSDSASLTLSLHGPPSQPQKPSVTKVTTTSARVKWVPPDRNGRSQVLSYQLEMLQAGFTSWQAIIQQPRCTFTIRTLEPSTAYQFRVIAYNKYGASKPSEPCVPISTKAKGWLNQPTKSKSNTPVNIPNINVNGPTEFTDVPPSDQYTYEEGLLSPTHPHPFIRRGSLSNAYDVIPEEVGRGRFGIVQKCYHKHSNMEMAVKYVRMKSKKKAAIRREVEILQKVRGKSPHIVEFYDAFERGRNLMIVTELVPDGELISRIIADNDFTEGVAVSYLSQLLSAVDCLHQLNIAHLDIRPENVLLAGGGHGSIKLIDFGSARDLSTDTSPVFTSSVEFCAPEIINQDLPALASDMWSVGVLTYVLLSGISPFFVDNIQMVVERIKEARYSFYNEQFDQVSQEAKDFIAALLQKSPEFRLTASNALLHPWIKTLVQVGENSWPMAKLDVSRLKTLNARRKWHTVSVAIDDTTVFGPRSMACLSPLPPDFEEIAKNEAHPQLWDGPTHISSTVGTSAIIQFQMTGRPEPTMIWEHNGEDVQPSDRISIVTNGGVTSLSIVELARGDGGVYTCSAINNLGSAMAECELTVTDIPEAPSQVNGVLLGSSNSALVSWLPPAFDGNCLITNYILEKKRLDFDDWEVVASDIDSTAQVLEDLIPDVAFVFRVAAVNEVGVSPYSIPSPPMTISHDHHYDSDSTGLEEVELKVTPFEFEYEMGQLVSRGEFGDVYKCQENMTNREYVVKVITTETEEQKTRAMQEFEMHRQLSHPRVTKLEDAFTNEQQFLLVLEHVSAESLEDYLSLHERIDEPMAAKYILKIMEGLQYLHDSKIIHTNLSPSSVLLTSGQKQLKLTDFSLARYIKTGNQLEELRGSVEYMAPEAVSLLPLTTAADIWSAGAIAYYMVTGRSPFIGPNVEATVSNISAINLDKTCEQFQELTNDCQDFITERTILRNPRRRLTALQCQRHRWLQISSSSSFSSAAGRRRFSGDRPPELYRRRGSTDSPLVKLKRASLEPAELISMSQ